MKDLKIEIDGPFTARKDLNYKELPALFGKSQTTVNFSIRFKGGGENIMDIKVTYTDFTEKNYEKTIEMPFKVLSEKGGFIIKKVKYPYFGTPYCSFLKNLLEIPFNLLTGKLSPAFWGNIFYLAVITSLCATPIYFFASKKLSANRASSFNLFVPFFAVLGSFLILHEIPKVITVAGGVFAMAAIYLINTKPSSMSISDNQPSRSVPEADKERPSSGQ